MSDIQPADDRITAATIDDDEAIVLYDRANHSAWVQSDYFISLSQQS
jgi:hypothetical protein